MEKLFRLLADWLIFFFNGGSYRLVDSRTGSGFEDAFIVWSSDVLLWRIVNDRSQVFLECKPVVRREDSWYSTDLLTKLVDDRKTGTSELSLEVAQWIERNLGTIEALFLAENLDETTRKLKAYKRVRAKELFSVTGKI